jgi:hypothetical protein
MNIRQDRCLWRPVEIPEAEMRYVRYAVAHRSIRFYVNCLLPVGLSIEPALIACVLDAATLRLQGKQNACRGYEKNSSQGACPRNRDISLGERHFCPVLFFILASYP